MPASSSAMADEEMRYQTVVGPLPVLSNPATWAPAWAREEARMGVAGSLAHATFRGIDPTRPSNPFAKHIAAMPHALVPSLGDQASSITVVRRSREVGYRWSYVGFMHDPPVDPPLVQTFEYILTVAQQNVDQVIGGREASRTCPLRTCTAIGPSDPGSQAARGDDTRHGLLAGDDGASHCRRPSS